MSSLKLHDWLQILGATGIIASLVFVGLQLKQSHEIAIANQYQARYDSILAQTMGNFESDVAMRVLGKRSRHHVETNEDLSEEFKAWAMEQTDEELAFQFWHEYINLKSWDNLYFQYQAGFLSEEAWLALRRQVADQLEASHAGIHMRMYYELDPLTWRAEFRELIDEIITEIDAVNR